MLSGNILIPIDSTYLRVQNENYNVLSKVACIKYPKKYVASAGFDFDELAIPVGI